MGILYAIVLPMLLLAFLLAKPLNALSLGDRYAGSMGVNVRLTRCAIVVFSSVLTAAVTAFAGPVSFIGLAVPHICRILFHTQDSRLLIPGGSLAARLWRAFATWRPGPPPPRRSCPWGRLRPSSAHRWWCSC